MANDVLIVLACHGVFNQELDLFHGEHPEDRPIHEAQLVYALKHYQWRADCDPLLVFSGGCTCKSLNLSESRSYLNWASALSIGVPKALVLEEFALTSVENVLLSLYRFHQTRGHYPSAIDIISWGFKERRFKATMDAISRWSSGAISASTAFGFFPVGDLPAASRDLALRSEHTYTEALKVGLSTYFAAPQVAALRRRRDPWCTQAECLAYYRVYPLPFADQSS